VTQAVDRLAYACRIAEIAFVVEDLEMAGVSVQPVIDGERLASWGDPGTCGMWLDGLARVLLPEVGERRRAPVLRCGCGDPGCDYATVEIESVTNEVVWRDFVFRRPRRPLPVQLRFPRDMYVRALEALPAEAWGDASSHPQFRPPGSPFLYLMTNVGRPGERVKVYAGPFEAEDQEDADRQAGEIATRRGLGAGEWTAWRLGTEFLHVEELERSDAEAEPESNP
jgi:hypothetical protein